MWLLGMVMACGADAVVVVDGRDLDGAPLEVRLEDGRIAAVGPTVERAGAKVVEAGGRTLLPGLIDSHVHIAYLPEAAALRAGGIAAVVDLASPLDAVGSEQAVEVLWSGPMITAPLGYPTQSWGRDGYGATCADATRCAAVVDRQIAAGAGVIKVPLDGGPTLTDATLEAVVGRAHAAGRKVVAHALSDADAARAARLGIDALAHLPTETLSDATIAAWKGRAVITTAGAFGGAAEANAARLHAAGVQLLYGTDFGNTQVRGIDGAELQRMVDAGLSVEEALASASHAAADWWGLEGVGRLAVGQLGMVVIVDDPHVDLTAVGRPWRVVGP